MSAPRADREQIHGRWLAWLGEIQQELFRAFLHQALWTQMRDEIQMRWPNADGTFLVSYTQVYTSHQLALIRRLADPNTESHSLVSLIRAIQRNPEVVTQSTYSGRWAERVGDDSGWAREGGATWDSEFADSSDREYVDGQMLNADALRIESELRHITDWATRTVAHLDPRRPERIPNYGELRQALDLLANITGRYQLLLDQSSQGDWTPVIQGDWVAPFRPTLFPIDMGAYDSPDPRGFS